MSSSPSPNKISSPPCTPSAAQPKPTALSRPLAELVGAPFAPFDADTVALPITEESNRDIDFHRELLEKVLDAALEAHAWAAARAFHETRLETESLEKRIMQIIATENDQEKARQRLADFVTSMQEMLSRLTAVF